MRNSGLYTELFSQIEIRSKNLPSRIVLAPINAGYALNGKPTARLMRFQRDRSSPSIGINFVGNVATSLDSRTNANTAILASEHDVPRFAVVARAINSGGSLSGIQLADSPLQLQAIRDWKTDDPFAELERLRLIVRSADADALHRILARFAISSRLAQAAGFDVIQLHAAHGYLLSLLLSPLTNTRQDHFCANGNWFLDFVDQLRNDLPKSLLSVRLNLFTHAASRGPDIEAASKLALGLERVGVDILDFSGGFYTLDRFIIYPLLKEGPLPLLRFALPIIAGLKSLTILSGNVIDLAVLNTSLPPRLLVGIGRAMIADADFATKTSAHRHSEIIRCRRCNHCHYFSRGGQFLECGVNKAL